MITWLKELKEKIIADFDAFEAKFLNSSVPAKQLKGDVANVLQQHVHAVKKDALTSAVDNDESPVAGEDTPAT